jgi:hypothetical protein
MAEPIGDESIYLRIVQFEKGLVQYSDNMITKIATLPNVMIRLYYSTENLCV